MKCDICTKKIETIYLNKSLGTMMRKEGKKKWVCSHCQKGKSKEELLKLL